MSAGPFVALYGGKTVEVNVASASMRSAKTRIAGPFPRTAENEALVQVLAAAPKLLAACQAQHTAIDQLMAMLITLDPTFKPTKSAIWPLLLQGNAAIAQATGQQGGAA